MPPGIKWTFGLLLLATLFIFRVEFLLWSESQDTVSQYAGMTAVVVGTVADDPDQRETSVRVVIDVETINGAVAEGRLLAMLPRESEVAYGERIDVRGFIEEPQAFEVEAGRMFDYPGYLRVRGVSAIMPLATLRSQVGAPWSVRGALYEMKSAFEHSLERTLHEPQGSLLEGILLGERGGFSTELIQLFVIAGLIHIVVFSGSNMAIVSEGIFRALGFLPRTVMYVVGAITIVLFAMLAGGGAATVRAVMMGLIAIIARYLRRPAAALRALIVAAICMVLWNPLVLLYDRGFILSMLATFGLIALAPAVEKWLHFVPAWERYNVRSIVATTLAVEIFLLPALLYYSGILSFVSLPMNAFVLPLVPLVMLFGFITGVLGLVHPLLALVPAFITDLLLRVILVSTEFAATLPFASTLVAPFPAWVALMVYVPLFFIAVRLYRNELREPTS